MNKSCTTCGGEVESAYRYQVEDRPLCPACYCDEIEEHDFEPPPLFMGCAVIVSAAMGITTIVVLMVAFFS